jgi:hypothetical protein
LRKREKTKGECNGNGGIVEREEWIGRGWDGSSRKEKKRGLQSRKLGESVCLQRQEEGRALKALKALGDCTHLPNPATPNSLLQPHQEAHR